MINVYFVRHGQTDWNLQGKLQGHSDILLNDEGLAQARALSESIKMIQGSHFIVSSDLQRAHKTASSIAKTFNCQIQPDSRLREVHLGEAEGLTREEIQEKWGPAFWEQWISDNSSALGVHFPNGETRAQSLERFETCLRQTLSSAQFENIWFVSHGLIIRTFLQRLFPTETQGFRMKNCAVQKLIWNNNQWLRAHDWNLF